MSRYSPEALQHDSAGPVTLQKALAEGTRLLQSRDELGESAALDARLLLLHALEITRAEMLAHPLRHLTLQQQARFDAMLDRRLGLEPIQYITGEQEFYGLMLEVTPAVLIPRPETELLVEAVLDRLASTPDPVIAEVGTGSGAIAVALAAHLPAATIFALDISESALEVARRNLARHGLEGQIKLLRSDLLASVSSSGPSFDAVVSNPPYIPLGEAGSLHPQVRDFEPSLALFAGASGLEVYERLLPQSAAALKPKGLLAFELGQGQCSLLRPYLQGWADVTFLKDLQGIERVLLARRS